MPIYRDLSTELGKRLERVLAEERANLEMTEVGTVKSVSRGVVEVAGLTSVCSNEVIRLPKGISGLAVSIKRSAVGLLLLGAAGALRPGDVAHRTHHVLSVPVGEELLGRVVDPLCQALDGAGEVSAKTDRQVWSAPPPILHRAPVREPLQTGIKAIDATIPIGRGQRELILGDRQTGKTAIAVASMINQKSSGVIGVYCAIGQRAATTARVIKSLKHAGMMSQTIVVSTTGNDPPGLQYVAPYAAMAMAEYFMHKGRDVLIVFDDLTRHARAYRELSLLLRRPPGREAYPGDIFHIHAQLLERATHLQRAHGDGSITALPIVETQAGNIAAYIPTNLISITDGQIYLSPKLFQMGVLPAIDIGRSVSRVGGKAQLPAYRAAVQALKLSYAQFEELESFAKFGTRLDDETRSAIVRGHRVREVLKQGEYDLLSVPEQVMLLFALTEGLLDDVPVENIARAEQDIRRVACENMSVLEDLTGAHAKFGEEASAVVLKLAQKALRGSGSSV